MRHIKLTLLILIAISATLPVFSQNCPQGPIQANNGQGGGSCLSGDNPPTGNPNWTKSGEWGFNSGPNSDLTIYTVYKGVDLYQNGNTLVAINGQTGNIWFGGYKASSKTLCFYSQSQNINTPASGNWKITFSSSGGAQCTYTVAAGGGITLPLLWNTVEIEKTNGQSLLKWSTASEQNTKDFEVQYSTNTNTWEALGTVPAAGNSSTTRNYSYTHQNPLKGNNYNYYRILQRDIDGKFSYSKIVSIIFNEPGAPVSLYPNPVHDVLTVFVETATSARLLNAAGATVWRGNLTAGRNQVTVATFSKGVYMLATDKGAFRVVIQ